MRLSVAVLASLLATLAVAVAGVAGAAPQHNRGLTISAPRRILAGEGVLIYGRLAGPNSAGQLIRLYHRLAPRPFYSLVGTTRTDTLGYYEFTRAEGVVDTNRSWFVRGPEGSHSRTVHERVDALVSLTANLTEALTFQPVTFAGRVFPGHPFQRVLLQTRRAGDDWRTIKVGYTGADSRFGITYHWRTPGAYLARVVFPGDRRNARGSSDEFDLTIQQRAVAGFTIGSSAQPTVYGTPVTISGVLDASSGTPRAGVPVTLLARTPAHAWTAVADAATGVNGGYSFEVRPSFNTVLMVRVTLSPSRQTAALFEGVHDQVNVSASATSGTSGTAVTFTGVVYPGRTGAVVYLQRLGRDGGWHTVAATSTNINSAYSIHWPLGDVGTDTFRTRVLADRYDFGNASAPVTLTVTAPASAQTLPAAS